MQQVASKRSNQILCMSTLAFAACFAVWTIFSIIGISIKAQLGLNETAFGLLIATPILTGSLIRMPLGIWSDRYGGRFVFVMVMLTSALATFLLPLAHTYTLMLLAALGVGAAGGSFSVGVAYVSRWYPKEKQGTALGIFGVGNVGATVSALLAPLVMVAYSWPAVARVWAAALVAMAVIFLLATTSDPVQSARRAGGLPAVTLRQQLAPLGRGNSRPAKRRLLNPRQRISRLWRGIIRPDRRQTGPLLVLWRKPRRHLHSVLSGDRFHHAWHPWRYAIQLWAGVMPFAALTFILGFFMSLGKAAIYRHIPVYYPEHVGPVGGAVGMIGGLGGFILPIVFGALNDLTGLWTGCFMLLFLLTAASLLWMHAAILRMEGASMVTANRRLEQRVEVRAAP